MCSSSLLLFDALGWLCFVSEDTQEIPHSQNTTIPTIPVIPVILAFSLYPIYAEWPLLPQVFGQVHFLNREPGLFLPLSHFVEISELNANCVDPDQTPRSAASDQGLHRLPMSLLWDARHNWVKVFLLCYHSPSLINLVL